MAKAKKSSSKVAIVKKQYCSKFVDDVFGKVIEKHISASSAASISTNQKWLEKVRKKVLGKLSHLSISLFAERERELESECIRLRKEVAQRSSEVKSAGIDSITESYQVGKENVLKSEQTPIIANLKEQLVEVHKKLGFINENINGTIDKEINARAVAISETVLVVQDAVNNLV